MKKIFVAFTVLVACCANATAESTQAYNVCGPRVDGMDLTYSEGAHGTWAVGSGCGGGATDNTYVPEMCTTVNAGGESLCSNVVWPATEPDEINDALGNHCYCRRTYMRLNDNLNVSIGQWVMLGIPALCTRDCARLCAENVVDNVGGHRNAIMLLPKIVTQ